MNHHELVMRNATRCADLIRISGSARVLSDELLEQGYGHTWYAQEHANRVARGQRTKGNLVASGRWIERRDTYRAAGRAMWAEMVRRGLRTEATVGTPALSDGRAG